MSTSSKPKSRAPAHQNTRAFKHNKNSKLTRKIALVGTEGLCRRCADKVEWRKKYRKYKPLTVPKTCNTCLQKRIKAAYRSICEACAEAGGKCPGCGNALGSRDDTRRNEEAELDAGGSSTAGEPQAAVSSTVSQHADEAEEKV